MSVVCWGDKMLRAHRFASTAFSRSKHIAPARDPARPLTVSLAKCCTGTKWMARKRSLLTAVQGKRRVCSRCPKAYGLWGFLASNAFCRSKRSACSASVSQERAIEKIISRCFLVFAALANRAHSITRSRHSAALMVVARRFTFHHRLMEVFRSAPSYPPREDA